MVQINIDGRQGIVNIDGVAKVLDLGAFRFDPNVKTLTWDGSKGLIIYHPEHRHRAPELGQKSFSDITPYQSIIDAWNTAPSPPAPTPRSADARIQTIPANVNSVPAMRAQLNQVLAYLRGE